MALSTQPYKGARDFYPEDKRLQKYIFSNWKKAVELFGYEEYDAPIIEPLDIYTAKTGQEIVNEQTYVFEDRGGRTVVIRPEMTPTVSRMVAGRRQQLSYPLRWYSIPNLWRYERPQKGRLREHWQLNVDIFGVEDVSSELEMINVIDAIFKTFGASREMYEIRINHRALVNYLLNDYLKLDSTEVQAITKLIDRMHKMERTKFITEIDNSLTDSSRGRGVVEKLLAILDAKNLSSLPKEAHSNSAYQELHKVLEHLKEIGMNNAIYDPTIMRGFDYYTGIVFEVFDTDSENSRSMLGGGRYDGLVGLYGVDPVPTVGFGWGDVTLVNFLETHSLMPSLNTETDLYVALVGNVNFEAQNVISELRNQGINVAVDFSGKKIGDQLKTANKRNIKYVLAIGENELSSGKYKLKDMQSGQEVETDIKNMKKIIETN